MISLVLLVGANAEDKKTDASKATKVAFQLGWFPEAPNGGEYAALAKGFFKDEGLDVEIKPGSPKVSTVQVVGAGGADIGLVRGDDLLLARNQGVPIVSVAAVIQHSPQALIYHKAQDLKSFEDLKGRLVIFVPTPGYDYIKYKYKLSGLNEQITDGSSVRFLNDQRSVLHGFASAEPAEFKPKNVEVGSFLISQSGYDPYEAVVFTTEKYLKANPKVVRGFIKALAKGWAYYHGNSAEINTVINKANPELPLSVLADEAALQEPFFYGGDAATEGFGIQKLERWETTKKQLLESGILKKDLDVKKAFTIDYLK
jgi:NitT/TauT family transport system substrate-binding protein